MPEAVGEHFVIGRPTALHSNGSVAPVALWPTASARVERFVRTGGFDVVHVHEPLAPMAAYGLVLRPPLPMVGTYHRAGVSRWVPVLKPLASLVGRRMQIRVAVSEAARGPACAPAAASSRCSSTASTWSASSRADPVRDEEGRPAVVFLGRHEERKGLSVLLDAFAMVERPAVLWVAGDGPGSEVQRRRYPESDRVRWLGHAERRGGGVALGGSRHPVRPVAARGVLRHGAPRGDGGRLHGGGLGHRGLPVGRGRARRAGPPRGCGRAGPCARGGAGRCGRGEWPLGARGTQGVPRVRTQLVDGHARRTLCPPLRPGCRCLAGRAVRLEATQLPGPARVPGPAHPATGRQGEAPEGAR